MSIPFHRGEFGVWNQVPRPLWALLAALSWAMPVFGWSVLALVTLEGLRLALAREVGLSQAAG